MKLNVEIRFLYFKCVFGLVNFLHSGSILGVSLERWHLRVVSGSINISGVVLLVNAETKLDHPVDPLGMDSGVFQTESRTEEGSLEQEEDEIFDRLVVLVSLGSLSEVLHDAVVGIDLEVLLGSHVAHGGGVAESLGLHDPLHVGGPAVLGGDDTAGRADQSTGDDDLLNLLVKNVLHDLAKRLELLLVSFSLLLFLLILGELKTLLGDRDEVLAIKLLQLLDDVLVNGLGHVDNLESSLLQSLDEGRGCDDLLALPGDVVDVLLVLLHPGDIISKRAEVISAGRGVVPQVSGQLLAVGRVLVDAKLQVLAELLVELLEVVLVLRKFLDELENLLDQVLSDDLEDLVLLEHLSGNVERKILGVNNTLDKVEIFWDEFFTVVHDEDSSDVQLDVVLALLVLKEIKRSSLGDEEQSSELKLTFNREMLHGKMLFPVIGQRFVEFSVFFTGNIIGSSGPDGFGLVQLLIFCILLLDGLLFLLVFIIFILVSFIIGANILDLWFIVLLFLLSFLLLIFSLILPDLLISLLLYKKSDRVSNELRVLLDNFLDLLFLKILNLILLHGKNNLCSSSHGLSRIISDGERTSSRRLPDVLFIIVVFGVNSDLVSHKIGGVESDAKLTNHRDISSSREGLHECFGSGLGDGSKIVDHVGLGHADTRVNEGESLGVNIRDNLDV